jgi:hypothetical protein
MRVGVWILAIGCGSRSPAPAPDGGASGPWRTASTSFDQALVGVSTSGSDVFVVGYAAASYHSTDGTTFPAVPLDAGTAHGSRIWARSATDVFATGFSGKMVHSADRGATWQPVATGATRALYTMWGVGTEIYVAGDDGVYHSPDGVMWRLETTPVSGHNLGLWGNGAGDIYVVGDGGIAHRSGDGTWAAQGGVLAGVIAVWGSSATDIYAVGPGVLHSDGSGTWTAQTGCGTAVYGIWGTSATDVWAVGPAGAICHSPGDGTWTTVDSGTTLDLTGIAGDGAQMYIVGGATTSPARGIVLRRP